MIDFESAAGTAIDIDVGYGYFFIDNLEGLVNIVFYDDDDFTAYGAGIAGEYNFDFGTELVPYLGAGMGYRKSDPKYLNSEDAFVMGMSGGVKYFLAENVALDTSLDFEYATAKIYPKKNQKFTDTDLTVNVGLRFFF